MATTTINGATEEVSDAAKTFAEMYGEPMDVEWERKASELSIKLESVKEGSDEERELLGLGPTEGLFAMRGFSEA